MAGAKEIRSKIASVQNTQKITKAMEMVAASKMRKSQDRMAASRPYAETMRKVIGHLANGNLEYKHPYLEERDVKRVGYLVVSTDRGLCGGLNINLFKKLLAEMKAWSDKGVQCDLAMIGSDSSSSVRAISSCSSSGYIAINAALRCAKRVSKSSLNTTFSRDSSCGFMFTSSDEQD